MGAPKSGTTGLFRYLAAHDGVAASSEKEPQFFCTDFPSLSKVADAREYRALFGEPGDRVTLEASVWYLHSREAVANIERIRVDTPVRYVVALRNPADVAVSLHGQFLRTFQEDVEDFATAWSLQEARAAGDRLPRHCPEASLLQYRRAISFGEQVGRLLDQVDRDRVFFADYRRLAGEPRELYVELLDFLGLDDDGRTDFAVTNPSRVLRWPWLVARLRNPSRVEGWLIDRVNPALKRRGIHPLALIRPHITKIAPRPTVDEELLAAIETELADDIGVVAQLTGIDLKKYVRLEDAD